jgi:ABC-type multidrug transport system ATPase subunit
VKITLASTGKKFYREWIFRRLDLVINSGEKIALLGPNGSGKSTLLQVLSGAVMPNEGTVRYERSGAEVSADNLYHHVTIAAPYLELIEDFTLNELIHFHFSFKKISATVRNSVLHEIGLENKKDSIYRYFSSGMKQRVKLALAICSDADLLLLDEPCSNLDASGISWYTEMMAYHCEKKTVIVASNTVAEEYAFCNNQLRITDFK